jgi:hypothetical protein
VDNGYNNGEIHHKTAKVNHMSKPMTLLFVILAAALVLTGCRQSQQESSNVTIRLAVEPDPPAIGSSSLVVALTDAQGTPIENAAVVARGDMTHAGMEPVTGEGAEESAGIYRVPFEWTMGGDWIVTVTVGLPDGQTTEETFNFTVPGE